MTLSSLELTGLKVSYGYRVNEMRFAGWSQFFVLVDANLTSYRSDVHIRMSPYYEDDNGSVRLTVKTTYDTGHVELRMIRGPIVVVERDKDSTKSDNWRLLVDYY